MRGEGGQAAMQRAAWRHEGAVLLPAVPTAPDPRLARWRNSQAAAPAKPTNPLYEKRPRTFGEA